MENKLTVYYSKGIQRDSFSRKPGDENISFSQMKKYLERISPICLQQAKKVFNYSSIPNSYDVECAQLKMALILFWLYGNYESLAYKFREKLGMETSISVHEYLSNINESGKSLREFLNKDMAEVVELLDMSPDSIQGIMGLWHRIHQTKKVPPMFFLSRQLRRLFLDTDLPTDLSFLLDHYSDMDFILCTTMPEIIAEDSSEDSDPNISLWVKTLFYCRLEGSCLKIQYFGGIDEDILAPLLLDFGIDLSKPDQSIYTLIKEQIGVKIRGYDSKENELILEQTVKFLAIALNFLLYSTIVPTFTPEPEPKKRKKGRKFSSSPVLKQPKFIDVDTFSSPKSYSQNPSGDSTSTRTVSPHFRRGHWKRVAIGKGRGDRVVRWIRPTYVNIKA